MRRGVLFLGIILVLLALAGVFAALVLHDGLSATATPTKLEEFLARNARRLATPSGARAMANPLQPSEGNLHDARLHFADHCATCHGNDGSGETVYGHGMYPKPPDLRLPATQNLSDGELFGIIQNGVRFTGMPAFAGHHGKGDDSWKLVLFIRHLPELTPAERAEMARYNPKGLDERAEEQQEDEFLNQAPQTPKPAAASKAPAPNTRDAEPK
ncbi:MAG: c-type cytochrome [Candidatus Acidiferrum sp.]